MAGKWKKFINVVIVIIYFYIFISPFTSFFLNYLLRFYVILLIKKSKIKSLSTDNSTKQATSSNFHNMFLETIKIILSLELNFFTKIINNKNKSLSFSNLTQCFKNSVIKKERLNCNTLLLYKINLLNYIKQLTTTKCKISKTKFYIYLELFYLI